MPNREPKKNRVIRVSDSVWNEAKAKAEERGEYLSDVIRKALERYIKSK